MNKVVRIIEIFMPFIPLAVTIFLGISAQSDSEDEINNISTIYTTEAFEDTIANGSGTYLVEGDMVVENPIISDDISGEYIYLVKESITKTQSFFSSWQSTDTEIQTCDNVSFLGVEIPMSLFIPLVENVESIYITDYTGYKYYGVEVMDYGTLEITIENGSIVSIDSIYPDMSVLSAKDTLKNNNESALVLFGGFLILCWYVYFFGIRRDLASYSIYDRFLNR